MARMYIRVRGIEKLVTIGRKKDLEKLKEKMEKDKQKIKKFEIEEIIVK